MGGYFDKNGLERKQIVSTSLSIKNDGPSTTSTNFDSSRSFVIAISESRRGGIQDFLDIDPGLLGSRFEDRIADFLGFESVTKRRSAWFFVDQSLQEIGNLMDEGVFVADL